MRQAIARHFFLIGLFILCTALPALAHRFHVSRSQWRILPDEGILGATLSLSGEDMGLLLNSNPIPEGAREGTKPRDLVFATIEKRLIVNNRGKKCRFKALRQSARDGKYRIGFRFKCAGPLTELELQFAFLPRLKAGHRHRARLDVAGHKEEQVLTRASWRYQRKFKTTADIPEPKQALPVTPQAPSGRWEWLWIVLALVGGGLGIGLGWTRRTSR